MVLYDYTTMEIYHNMAMTRLVQHYVNASIHVHLLGAQIRNFEPFLSPTKPSKYNDTNTT